MVDIIKDQPAIEPLEAVGRVAVHNDYSIVDFEDRLSAPARKRGDRTFETIEGWAAYVGRHQSKATCIYPQGQGVVAVLNDHEATAGHGDHRALLVERRTAAFSAWLDACDELLSQEQFADLIEEHADSIAAPPLGELMDVATQLRATRSMTVESTRDARSGGTRIAFEAAENAAAGGEAVIPRQISLLIKLYEWSDDPRKLLLKLRWRLVEKRVAFDLTLVAPAMDDAIRDERAWLDARIKATTGLDVWR